MVPLPRTWSIVIPLTIVFILSVAGCASPPASPPTSAVPTEPDRPEPVSVSTQRNGVVVTVSASAGRVVSGDRVDLRIDVLNAGFGPVTWRSGGCELLNTVLVEGPPMAQPPAGRDWPSAAGLAKFSATAGGTAIDGIRAPGVPDDAAFGCRMDLFYDEIDPGQTISAEAVWFARTSDGAPAAPGAYRIAYAFPYVGRMPSDEIGPDPQVEGIALGLDVAVDGTAFAGLPPTLAIDAALADARVAAWFADLPAPQMNGAEIRYVDGQWRFTVKVAGDRETVVFMDAASGRIAEVRIAD